MSMMVIDAARFGAAAPPAAATMPSTALYLPGTSGNYVSTPDDASLDLDGDCSIVACVAFDDWTPSVRQVIASKFINGWEFRVESTTGELTFIQNGVGYDSSIAPSVSDGDPLWVACTWDISSGDIKFWTSVDSPTTAIGSVSWSQLGSTVAGPTIASTGTNSVVIGARASTLTDLAAGVFYRCYLYTGIGANTAPGQGTLVYEADFSHPWVGNRYTDSTGKVSTINGSAWAWEVVS